jgi:hypothetical protein
MKHDIEVTGKKSTGRRELTAERRSTSELGERTPPIIVAIQITMGVSTIVIFCLFQIALQLNPALTMIVSAIAVPILVLLSAIGYLYIVGRIDASKRLEKQETTSRCLSEPETSTLCLSEQLETSSESIRLPERSRDHVREPESLS